MKKVVDRMRKPTPKFFCKLRNITIGAAAIGAAIIAAPVAIPAILVKIAGYLVVAGSVAGTVSQAAVCEDE